MAEMIVRSEKVSNEFSNLMKPSMQKSFSTDLATSLFCLFHFVRYACWQILRTSRIVLSEKMNAHFIIFYLIISIYSPKKENEAKRFCSKESIFYTANGLLYYNLTSFFFHKRPISYFPSLSETIFLRISYARFFSFVKRLLSVYDIVP